MIDIDTVAVPGPLEAHKEALGADLFQRGYTPLTIRRLLHLAAHLSRWVDARGIGLHELSTEDVHRFVMSRRQASSRKSMTPAALDPILGYLQRCGAIPVLDFASAQEQLPTLLLDYNNYLLQERSLTRGAARQYLDVAQRFLAVHRTSDSMDVTRIGQADVIAFILDQARRYSIGTTQLSVTALRAFLRYLHVTGQISVDLSQGVPGVAGWRLAGLPQGLKPNEVRQLLATCDRRTHAGRTAFALLLLLMRLGLRCCEVAALELEDIDWRQGQMTIRGKGKEECLPLPEDVGQALIAHLQVRRRDVDDRHVFLRRRAPMGRLGSGAIKAMVKKHMSKAAISPPHPHRLRHTTATEILNKGASLDQVAQVLRHASVDTSAIYAKVDLNRLRELSQAWPEVDHE